MIIDLGAEPHETFIHDWDHRYASPNGLQPRTRVNCDASSIADEQNRRLKSDLLSLFKKANIASLR